MVKNRKKVGQGGVQRRDERERGDRDDRRWGREI